MATILVLLFMLLVFGGMIAVIVMVIVTAHRKAQERRAEMAGYAAHREWEFTPSDPSLLDRFHGAPFGQGRARAATNVLRGRHEGRWMVAFDYAYTTSSGVGQDRRNNRHVFSVVALNLGVAAPELSVGPTGALGALFNAITGRDIRTGMTLFDDRFTITSPSVEFARDVLQPPVVDLMLQHPELAWRFAGDSMLMIRRGAQTVPEIEARLQLMTALLARVPEHVWTRLGATPA